MSNLSQLIIVAHDMGQPVPYETTQFLQVNLKDIDDNEPVFLKPPVSVWMFVVDLLLLQPVNAMSFLLPAPQRGSLPYQLLTVPEHSSLNTEVGNVTRAVDADEGSNAIVYYFIAGDVEHVLM